MHYGHSPEKAKLYATQALALIDKSGLPRRPDIYELFYAYVCHQMPEVTRALDKIYGKGLLPNEDDCSLIYKMHISNSAQEEMMLHASDTVSETISDVRQIVGAIQEATQGFGSNITGISEKMAKATKLEDVADLVKSLMTETATIVTKNQELETQLERSSEAVEAMKEEIDTVRREALTDALTGLANRKHFDRKLDQSLRDYVEKKEKFCLLVLDIDHFKSFNDTYGHQVGDRVLMLLARVLQDHAGQQLFPARFGGEEFVVIAHMSASAALEVAESIRQGIASKEVINKTTGDRLGQVTISIGVAEIHPGELLSSLVERADQAMYAAKHAGRNQVKSAEGEHKTPAV